MLRSLIPSTACLQDPPFVANAVTVADESNAAPPIGNSYRPARSLAVIESRSCFPPHIRRLLVLGQRHEARMPQVIVLSPLHELELPHEPGLEPSALCHFADVRPAPQRPAFFSGKFANGHSLISSGLIFLNSSAREAGVNPLRVLAAYISLSPS